jgi:hypothetical protein
MQQSGDHPLEDVKEVAISPRRFSQNLAINQKKLRSTIFYLSFYIFAYILETKYRILAILTNFFSHFWPSVSICGEFSSLSDPKKLISTPTKFLSFF